MPVTKDGNKYRARFTHNGVRIDLKRFDTEAEAELAIGLKKQELNDAEGFNIPTPYKPKFEETDTDISFIKALRNLATKLRLARK
jgi:hypothetical protein